jgi:type IV secretory pathway TrbL component
VCCYVFGHGGFKNQASGESREKMKKIELSTLKLALGLTLLWSVLLAGCGGKVQGNTYAGNGGVVQVEFKSGGKAYVSTGPVSTACTYTESGKTVTLVCESDKTVFTVDDDGALIGPPGGMLGRLEKKK